MRVKSPPQNKKSAPPQRKADPRTQHPTRWIECLNFKQIGAWLQPVQFWVGQAIGGGVTLALVAGSVLQITGGGHV